MPNTDEMPSDTPADIYERYMVPAVSARWSVDLLDRVKVQPGERVLDVACGTGIVARTAASMAGATGIVVGLDMNATMLDKARSIDASIEWREGDALVMPFRDQEFDVVVCQQGIQFFPDRLQAVQEMHRVLRPNGRLGISVWYSLDTSPGYVALAEALERHVDAKTASLVHTQPQPNEAFPLREGSEIRTLLEQSGFREVNAVRESKMARYASPKEFTRAIMVGSIMRRTGTRVSEETMQLLMDDVSAQLQAYVSADGLAFPMEANVATARK